jgi:ABC-type nitrate/sulfonate/bicarbonate transport system permease component
VVWPSALPYLLTGLRLSATIALVLAITAELVIGVPGLGTAITLAQNGARVPTVYALTVATGILGLIINLLMRAVESRVLAWHSSVRGEAIV